jgi:hypothetical protein
MAVLQAAFMSATSSQESLSYLKAMSNWKDSSLGQQAGDMIDE